MIDSYLAGSQVGWLHDRIDKFGLGIIPWTHLELVLVYELYEWTVCMVWCVYNKAPSPIQQLVNKKQDSSRIILRNQVNNPLDLKVPNLKTRAGTHSYSVKGPIFWNETPNVQKTIDKRETFKKVIKRCLLNSYSSHSTCNNPMCRDHQHHQ